LLAGYLIKLLSPKTKLVLMAHGIEVWKKFPAWKKKMLGKCDLVLTVSRFTREKIIAANGVHPGKVQVLNNCLDPFLPLPVDGKDPLLLERYGLKYNDIILMTLTRLSSREKYKGYDNVLCSIHQLKQQYPQLKYLVVGKYDTEEKQRLDGIINTLNLTGDVVFAGFIPDNELSAHFELADLYIMPSKKEGFGIVFIEAMYYGKPVIAGNKDGSADALCNGKFGLLVNPDETAEITTAIAQVLEDATAFIPDRYEIIAKFSFEKYKENLEALLFHN